MVSNCAREQMTAWAGECWWVLGVHNIFLDPFPKLVFDVHQCCSDCSALPILLQRNCSVAPSCCSPSIWPSITRPCNTRLLMQRGHGPVCEDRYFGGQKWIKILCLDVCLCVVKVNLRIPKNDSVNSLVKIPVSHDIDQISMMFKLQSTLQRSSNSEMMIPWDLNSEI